VIAEARLASLRPWGYDLGGAWVGDSMEIYDARDSQRRVTEYIRLDPFSEVIGSKTPRYNRGQRYCERCELAFYTMSLTCPICGAGMRTEPKRGKSAKYIDPERYGLEA